ncbi:MAG: hypothetical protein KDK51_08010, partial [Deltaproteobacteria bacterium]|nr:hypothetical protein [Deltaproteobacteria bacterium]
MHFFFKTFTCLILLFLPQVGKTVEFNHPSYASQTGYQRIEWSLDSVSDPVPVIVEVSKIESFESSRILYAGKNQSVFVSGLRDGNFYFRIKPAGGDWSSRTTLKVQHHSLYKAFVLFFIGLLVFVLTVLVI